MNLLQFIVDYGTCRPIEPFPKDESQENRSFSVACYNMVSKAGLSVEVSWLAYSPILDSAYCDVQCPLRAPVVGSSDWRCSIVGDSTA